MSTNPRTCAHTCQPFPSAAQRASSPARTRPARPRARPSPATRLPSCAESLFCPISRKLSYISRNVRTCLCNPFNRRRGASSAACARPAPRRGRPPPATPSAVMRPKFLSRSLVNSRVSLVHLSYVRSCLSTPPSAAKGPPARPVRRRRVSRVAPKISCPISHNLS